MNPLPKKNIWGELVVYFIAYRRQMYPKFAVKGLLSAINRLDTFIKLETDPSKKKYPCRVVVSLITNLWISSKIDGDVEWPVRSLGFLPSNHLHWRGPPLPYGTSQSPRTLMRKDRINTNREFRDMAVCRAADNSSATRPAWEWRGALFWIGVTYSAR